MQFQSRPARSPAESSSQSCPRLHRRQDEPFDGMSMRCIMQSNYQSLDFRQPRSFIRHGETRLQGSTRAPLRAREPGQFQRSWTSPFTASSASTAPGRGVRREPLQPMPWRRAEALGCTAAEVGARGGARRGVRPPAAVPCAARAAPDPLVPPLLRGTRRPRDRGQQHAGARRRAGAGEQRAGRWSTPRARRTRAASTGPPRHRHRDGTLFAATPPEEEASRRNRTQLLHSIRRQDAVRDHVRRADAEAGEHAMTMTSVRPRRGAPRARRNGHERRMPTT